MKLIGHQIEMEINGRKEPTLADILPESGPMRMLIVGKTPAQVSVDAGHYFQGRHGRMFWEQLKDHCILSVPEGEYEDDHLLEQGFGVTDVVKCPHEYGQEPSLRDYLDGRERILETVSSLQPAIVLFVYKKALDKTMGCTSRYGFNPDLESVFGAKVFVCPLPGVGGQTREEIFTHMAQLRKVLIDLKQAV